MLYVGLVSVLASFLLGQNPAADKTRDALLSRQVEVMLADVPAGDVLELLATYGKFSLSLDEEIHERLKKPVTVSCKGPLKEAFMIVSAQADLGFDVIPEEKGVRVQVADPKSKTLSEKRLVAVKAEPAPAPASAPGARPPDGFAAGALTRAWWLTAAVIALVVIAIVGYWRWRGPRREP